MKTLADIFTGKPGKVEFRLYDCEVTCAVCFSICFDSDVSDCRECGWPLRPEEQKGAFGFEGVCRNADEQCVELHRVGGINRLRSAAKQKGLTLLSFRAFDEKRWIQAFGNPAEKGL